MVCVLAGGREIAAEGPNKRLSRLPTASARASLPLPAAAEAWAFGRQGK
jgi:hypothetical protein